RTTPKLTVAFWPTRCCCGGTAQPASAAHPTREIKACARFMHSSSFVTIELHDGGRELSDDSGPWSNARSGRGYLLRYAVRAACLHCIAGCAYLLRYAVR